MKRFTRVNGHVLSSVMEFVEDCRRDPIPTGWNVRTKCRPDEEWCVDQVIDELEKLNERVVRKNKHTSLELCAKGNCSKLKAKLMMELSAARTAGAQVSEEEVMRVKPALRDLVVSPIDKLVGDAAIL